MRFPTTLLIAVLLSFPLLVQAEKETPIVEIVDPFIELHTGAGDGFPIFYVVDRGEQVELLVRRTDWVKVKTERGTEGWASVSQMRRTLEPDGEPAEFKDGSLEDYRNHRWELGFLAGDFGGANVLSGYGSYSFTQNLSVELGLSQLLGNVSDGYVVAGSLVHTFFPKWRASPFFSLGTGVIEVKPKSTLVQAQDRKDQTAIVGVGVKAYVTRRIMFRAEYKNYMVFTSRDENEDVNEWKLGFSVFY